MEGTPWVCHISHSTEGHHWPREDTLVVVEWRTRTEPPDISASLVAASVPSCSCTQHQQHEPGLKIGCQVWKIDGWRLYQQQQTPVTLHCEQVCRATPWSASSSLCLKATDSFIQMNSTLNVLSEVLRPLTSVPGQRKTEQFGKSKKGKPW